jgi:hypothetical protein
MPAAPGCRPSSSLTRPPEQVLASAMPRAGRAPAPCVQSQMLLAARPGASRGSLVGERSRAKCSRVARGRARTHPARTRHSHACAPLPGVPGRGADAEGWAGPVSDATVAIYHQAAPWPSDLAEPRPVSGAGFTFCRLREAEASPSGCGEHPCAPYMPQCHSRSVSGGQGQWGTRRHGAGWRKGPGAQG